MAVNPAGVTRIQVALTPERRAQLVEVAGSHGFSPKWLSQFCQTIVEAGLNIAAEHLVDEPGPEHLLITVPNDLVRELEQRSKALNRHRFELLGQIIVAWLRAHANEIPVDKRIISAQDENRTRTSLRLQPITIHRLMRLARSRFLSLQYLIEDLLLQASENQDSIPHFTHKGRTPMSVRGQRETTSIYLLEDLSARYTALAIELEYPTRTDLLETVLESFVTMEPLMKRLFKPGQDELERLPETTLEGAGGELPPHAADDRS